MFGKYAISWAGGPFLEAIWRVFILLEMLCGRVDLRVTAAAFLVMSLIEAGSLDVLARK